MTARQDTELADAGTLAILNQQAERLARSEHIHRTFIQIVLAGDGLDAIAKQLAELIDGPAAIVGRDDGLLASARLDDISHAVDTGAVGMHVLDERTIELDGVPVAGLAVPISAGGRRHGWVVALQGDDEPVDDRAVLEHAATVAALALTKDHEIQAVESKYQSDLMHDLLTGRGLDRPDLAERAALFGWDLHRRLIAVVVRFDAPIGPTGSADLHPRGPLGQPLGDLVVARDTAAAVVRFSDEVVMLTRAFDPPDGRDAARAFAHTLTAHVQRTLGVTASAGLSRPVEDPSGVPGAYAQAERALTIGRQIHGDGAVAHFDDLGVHRLLSLIDDVDELRAFTRETLGSLADDDEQARDLRTTLRVLLEANGNVAEAARRLHFHYNTLRYRIDKLERLVGPFTTDPRLRLDTQVALLLVETAAVRGGVA